MTASYRELEKEIVALRGRVRTIEKDRLNGNTLTVNNNKRFAFEELDGTRGNVFIVNDTSDNMSIANITTGGDIFLIIAMASDNQRSIWIREDGSSDTMEMRFSNDIKISTASGDIVFDEEGGIYMPNLPTSDPTSADQLWNDSGTLKVSAG